MHRAERQRKQETDPWAEADRPEDGAAAVRTRTSARQSGGRKCGGAGRSTPSDGA